MRLILAGVLSLSGVGVVAAMAADPARDVAPPATPATAEAAAVTPAEWAQVDRFMTTHSPQKWSMVRGKFRDKLAPQLLARYQQLEIIRVADTERYRLELTALHLEDEIYGVLCRLRKGENAEAELHAKVEQLIDNRMSWRRERMQRSLRELKALNAREAADALSRELDRDEKNRDKQRADRVERRMDELLKQVGRKGSRPGFPSRGLGGPVVPQTAPAD